MAFQVLKGPETFGSGLGKGLSSGLQQLAKMKMQESIDDRREQGFEKLGLPGKLAHLDPRITQEYIRQQSLKQQQLEDFTRQQQEDVAVQQARQGTQEVSDVTDVTDTVQSQVAPDQKITDIDFDEFARQTKQEISLPERKKTFGEQSEIFQKEADRISSNPGISPKRKALEEKRLTGKIDRATKAQDKIDKKFAPFLEDISKQKKAAFSNDLHYDAMNALSEKGNLDSPQFVSSIKSLEDSTGIDLNYMLTPDTQLFKKLRADFMKHAKDIFGSRVTNFDLQSFMQIIPGLMQSKEGRRRVIQVLKKFGDIDKAKFNVARDIERSHGGYLPKNFEDVFDKKMKIEEKRISEEFNELIFKGIDESTKKEAVSTGKDALKSVISWGVPIATAGAKIAKGVLSLRVLGKLLG